MFERITTLPVTPAQNSPEYIVERSGTPGDAFWDFRFTVLGKGEFPFDMLRSDNCWPGDTTSALHMMKPETAEERRQTREIVMISRQVRKFWLPEFGRWASFGWHVKSTAWEQ